MYLLDVYVTNASLNIDRPFTYYSLTEVKAFCRVNISFNHRKTLGFVSRSTYSTQDINELSTIYPYKIAAIINVIDEEPIMDEKMFALAKWLAKVTISPFISCLNIMLPKTLKTSTAFIKSKMVTRVRKVLPEDIKLTKRQKEVYDLITDDMLLRDVNQISPTISRKLRERGAITTYEDEYRSLEKARTKKEFIELNTEQKQAFKGIIASQKTVNLLYGVTGSGKTEVYLHLAKDMLSKGKQVLILVPEIALTPQMIQRVKERFDNVAIYHSYLSDQKKHEEYQRVLKREADIVVGTRSAVFLPFCDLGMIIIDEEHDHSYKQDNVPCYNAKMVAYKRAKDCGAKVLLASATPSLDVYTRAIKGDYGFFKLTKRVNEQMPDIRIIDLDQAVKKGSDHIISDELNKRIGEVLDQGKQVIILINRKAYATIIRCAECNSVLQCEDCDVALSYHNDTNTLKCNVCGRTYSLPERCPNCHSTALLRYGFGTKRVVETLAEAFPAARIGRLDADNTKGQDSHEMILKQFAEHQYDILVGTQMLAKGLDFEDVVLVGILNADSGLMHTDYNSSETTFDLLMQAAGRSGRAKHQGQVIIQAFNPEHYVLKAVASQSYESFYKTEMNYRFKANYPPYIHLIAIYISDLNLNRLNRSLALLNQLVCRQSLSAYDPMILRKLNKKHRARILLKARDLPQALNALTRVSEQYHHNSNISSLKIDVDPLYLE